MYGDQYFPRKIDEKRIWRKLDKNSHILLLAPRRTGKTSLLLHLQEEPKDGYVFLYTFVQPCNTEHEFYETIIGELFSSEFMGHLLKLKNWTSARYNQLTTSIKGITIADAGIKIDKKDRQLSHYDLKLALESLELDEKLIVVIDEFPDVLENIHHQQGHDAARHFLAGCRDLWTSPQLSKKVQYVITGSIGLDHLVHRLGLSNLINVLKPSTVTPLTEKEASKFIRFLIKKSNDGINLNGKVEAYLFKKIEWLMPYYIEILYDQLEEFCCENEIDEPTMEHVDQAYEIMFSQNYLSNFIHWAERLDRFNKEEKLFAKQILNLLAQEVRLNHTEVYNLAQEPSFQAVDCSYVFNCLEHDGYLYEADPKIYQFTTPMLKEWWSRYANRNL